MQSAFDFLKARNTNGTLPVDSIEEKMGLKFPPAFRIYLEIFVLGKNVIRTESFYSRKDNVMTLGSTLLKHVFDLLKDLSLAMISAIWSTPNIRS